MSCLHQRKRFLVEIGDTYDIPKLRSKQKKSKI